MAVLALLTSLASCEPAARTADGAAGDSTLVSPPAPGLQPAPVTSADTGFGTFQFRLTDPILARLDTVDAQLAALRESDPQARAFLEQNLVAAPTVDSAAAIRLLQSQPAVRGAIESAGMTAEEYFLAAVAVARARRFLADSTANPPTPIVRENAHLLARRAPDGEAATTGGP